jgi:uncharacterized protein (DUF433 family)
MPQKRTVKTRDVLNNIRAGMTDPELMQKYGLSAKGLQSLFRKLLEVKAITPDELEQRRAVYQDTAIIQQIDGNDIVEDIRAGMSDSELMEKYGLSSEGLGFALQTLTDTKVISLQDLYGSSLSEQDTVAVESTRVLPRSYLAITVHIYESKHPEIKGTLNDITERGVAITGIQAKVGEDAAFIIPTGNFIAIDPIMFAARCQWAEKEKDSGEWLAGFEITSISPKCLDDLRSLIQSASISF